MVQIQFKRVLTYNGDLTSAIYNITNNLDPALTPGEPLLCSYNDNGVIKYLLAVGVSDGNIRIIPSFTDEAELISFIKTHSVGLDIEDNISDASDVTLSKDSDGKILLKLQDNLKNIWINL